MVMLQVEDIAYQSLNNVLTFTYKEELWSLGVGFPKAGSHWKNTYSFTAGRAGSLRLILYQLGYWSAVNLHTNPVGTLICLSG